MSNTPNLDLPYIMPSQAQKHVTHNEAILALDTLVQLSISSRQEQSPPLQPESGERYIVAQGGVGEWQGQDGTLAAFQGGTWRFSQPSTGWVCWASDEGKLLVFHDDEWREVSGNASSTSQALDHLGINATADEINRLSINASNTLFNHDGTSHRISINKNSEYDTSSIVFQSGFEAVGEIGLLGDDDLRLKVTRDQTVWHDAMIIDGATGQVSFPNTNFSGSASLPASTNLLINSDMKINQRGFEGGLLQADQYGYDRWKAGSSGADVSVSDTGVTLTSGSMVQVVEQALFGFNNTSGLSLVVSVQDLSGGNLRIKVGDEAAIILSAEKGTISQGVLLSSLSSGSDIAIEIEVIDAPIKFRRCKLEVGTDFSGWNQRNFQEELSLCQRYCQKSYALEIKPGTATQSNQLLMRDVQASAFKDGLTQTLAIEMRGEPDVVWFSPISGEENALYGYGAISSDKQVVATVGAGSKSTGYPNIGAAFGGSNILWTAHYLLEAEL